MCANLITDGEARATAAVKESQQTTPKRLEIPVPKHSEVMDVLKKVAPPVKCIG